VQNEKGACSLCFVHWCALIFIGMVIDGAVIITLTTI